MTTLRMNRPNLKSSNALFSNSPFASFFDEFVNPVSYQENTSYVPGVNISETNESYGLEFSAPGFSKDKSLIY